MVEHPHVDSPAGSVVYIVSANDIKIKRERIIL
jgi:hypothetical protein